MQWLMSRRADGRPAGVQCSRQLLSGALAESLQALCVVMLLTPLQFVCSSCQIVIKRMTPPCQGGKQSRKFPHWDMHSTPKRADCHGSQCRSQDQAELASHQQAAPAGASQQSAPMQSHSQGGGQPQPQVLDRQQVLTGFEAHTHFPSPCVQALRDVKLRVMDDTATLGPALHASYDHCKDQFVDHAVLPDCPLHGTVLCQMWAAFQDPQRPLSVHPSLDAQQTCFVPEQQQYAAIEVLACRWEGCPLLNLNGMPSHDGTDAGLPASCRAVADVHCELCRPLHPFACYRCWWDCRWTALRQTCLTAVLAHAVIQPGNLPAGGRATNPPMCHRC